MHNGTAALDAARLLKLSQAELDALFMAAQPGPIPHGQADGTVIIAPGTVVTPEIAEFVNMYAWLGKTFDARRGELTNRILPLFGVTAIVAKVYRGMSWLDRRECIVLDYRKTSLAFRNVRDELRLIAPAFYLGRVYWNRFHTMDFCLRFPRSSQPGMPLMKLRSS